MDSDEDLLRENTLFVGFGPEKILEISEKLSIEEHNHETKNDDYAPVGACVATGSVMHAVRNGCMRSTTDANRQNILMAGAVILGMRL
jgi:hypothetical protein